MQKNIKLSLFNTLSKRVEEFIPMNPDWVGFYACGPTVYDYTHLGHLRRYTMDDVLVRLLKTMGYQVKFVQNITDVGHLTSDADVGEDKLEKGAKKYNQTVWQVAEKFTKYFLSSNDQMGNLRPDVACKATDHIKEQIVLIQTLEAKGFTYVIDDDGVYFDTSKVADYGKLAGLKLDQLLAGARVELIKGKKNPTDFALWKFEKATDNRQMSWPSPWHERGFPGWHIECSAMSQKYLGDQFDLHSGGIDHIPVHHTNEIAQTESATGKKPFVRYWIHHGFMNVDGQKMSKSLGNFFTIDDVVARGFSPKALRLLFFTAHYRGELNFTWENLAGMDKAYRKLVRDVSSWKKDNSTAAFVETALTETFRQKFWSHISNDLDTTQALAILWQVVKAGLSNIEKLQLVSEFDQVLHLGLNENNEESVGNQIETKDLPIKVQELLGQRALARQNKDYALADTLRKQIEENGYQIKDTNLDQVITS